MLISQDDRLSFEKSKPGRRAVSFPEERFSGEDPAQKPPEGSFAPDLDRISRKSSESDIVRHFINLSRKNYSVDTHLLSARKLHHEIQSEGERMGGPARRNSRLFTRSRTEATAQGMFQILWELEEGLKEITGMDRFTLQPAAGAHGELTGHDACAARTTLPGAGPRAPRCLCRIPATGPIPRVPRFWGITWSRSNPIAMDVSIWRT